jgi:hypothetical protein
VRRRAAFVPIASAPTTIALRDRGQSRIPINFNASQLSLFRLSFALSIIGAFWMVVKLHEYVVWSRGLEKALLLIAVVASCVAIYVDQQIRSDPEDNKPEIERVFWVSAFCLLTFVATYIIYLTASEPSPISLQFSEDVPEAWTLKLEGLAIIVIILVPFVIGLARFRVPRISRRLPFYVIAFCLVSALSHVVSFFYSTCGADFPHTLLKCHGPGIADIGGTTLNAAHAIENGINPYRIDVQGNYDPTSAYPGYRYWPMMFAIYTPLVFFFKTGWGVIRLTNFLLDGITTALIIHLASRRSGWLGGVLAASLYLMLPMLSDRLYRWADTDLVPMVFLLAALAFYQTRPGVAGVLVGLSVSAKFIPGLLMLICCFPEFRRAHYVGGFMLGLIPAIAFCVLAPSQFLSNTVLYLLATPIDISSLLYGAPGYLNAAARFAVILLIIAVSSVMIFRPPGFFERCVLYIICVIATLLASHVHNNYMLWWIPVFCILLSSPLSRTLSLPGSSKSD